MDRVLNPKDEKQTIYEIYRGCRLCGAGAGYKMPIIQNVIDLDGDGIELRQKIKECVQIEVSHTDRMPPLICELCVDKVNDFYEFLDMCKQNNRRTRLRLGLPLHTPTRDSVDSENCILGVTEPMFINSDSENHRQKNNKAKVKKEPEVKIKAECRASPPPPAAVTSRPRPPAPRMRPHRTVAPILITQIEKPIPPGPRRATRQHNDTEITPMELLTENKLKRQKDKDAPIEILPPKKAKTIPEPLKIPVKKIIQKEPVKPSKPQPKTKTPPKTTPKSPPKVPVPRLVPKLQNPKSQNSKLLAKLSNSKVSSKTETKPVETKFICLVCSTRTKTSNGLAQHCASKHVPSFTSPKNACNACELWFSTSDEAASHHRQHRTQNEPYKCTRCYGYFKLQQEYDDHFGLGQCLSEWEVPDARCASCWATFPTARLLDQHPCPGPHARPGGKCSKCNRSYALLKNLVRHESTCTHKRKGDMKLSEELRSDLLPMEVRISRCDDLLKHGSPVHCGALSQNFGLDKTRHYPYFRTRVKTEPIPMVAIHSTIKEEYSSAVPTLRALCLRSVQTEITVKDEPDFEDISSQINNIIDHLTNDDQNSCESDSILDKDTENKDLDTNVSENKELNDSVKETKVEMEVTKSKEGNDVVLNKVCGDTVKEVELTDSREGNDVSDIGGIKKEVIDAVKDMNTMKEVEIALISREGIDEVLNKEDSENVNESELTVKSIDTDQVLNEGVDSLKEKELSVVKDSDTNEVLNKESDNCLTEAEAVGDVEMAVDSEDKELSGSTVNEMKSDRKVDDLESLHNEKDTFDNVEHFNDEMNNVDSREKTEVQSENNDKELESTGNCSLVEDIPKNDKVDSNTELPNGQNVLVSKNDSQNDQMEVDIRKDIDETIENTENNENFAKIDEITNKILKDESNNDSVVNQSDQKSGLKANGVKIQDKFNVNDLNEDDRKLMAELDEQIGESEHEIDPKESKNESDYRFCENGQRSEIDRKITDNMQTIDSSQKIDEHITVDHYQRISDGDQGFTGNDITDVDQRSESDQRTNDNEQKIDEIVHKTNENYDRSKNHCIDEILKRQEAETKSLDLDSISDDEFNFDI